MEIAKDYRAFIERAFAERRSKNARYSMRAFARDIGISPGQLSLILSGKRGMSSERALTVSHRLGLDPRETDHFRTLVEMAHSRSAVERRMAESKMHAIYESSTGEAVASHAFVLAVTEPEAAEIRERIAEFGRDLSSRYDGDREFGELHVVQFRFFRVAGAETVSGKS